MMTTIGIFLLTTKCNQRMIRIVLLIEGRLPETVHRRSKGGVPRLRLVTAGSGGTDTARRALRPVPRGASLHELRRKCRRRKRGTGAENRHGWSAERRASRVMGRRALRKRPGVLCTPHRVPLHPGACWRSAHPSRWGLNFKDPGAIAPRERDGLFDK
jgi:hypothetical protein